LWVAYATFNKFANMLENSSCFILALLSTNVSGATGCGRKTG